MLSKNKIKFINSLKIKKNRNSNNLFIAEGEKLILDILGSEGELQTILSTNPNWLEHQLFNNSEKLVIEDSEMKKISSLKTATTALAVFKKTNIVFDASKITGQASIYCDGIQNPGNLGTIIRTADWFGIKNVICSNKSADLYNSKTIQATMGAIARVKVYYEEPSVFFPEIQKNDIHSYGAFLGGKSIYDVDINPSAVFVIGSEGKGISKEVELFLDEKVTIPRGGKDAESLNAAIAAGIIMAEYKRRF